MEQNGTEIIYFFLISTFFLCALSVVIIVIVVIHQRKVLRHNAEMLNLTNVSHDEMIRAHMQSQEEEKKQITADMHDEIGPLLSIVKMKLAQLSDRTQDPSQQELIGASKKILEDAIHKIRNLSKSLYSEVLNQFGLVGAVEEFVQVMQQKTDIRIIMEDHGVQENRFSKILETNLFRTIQELTNNLVKHSGARQLLITMDYHNQLLTVTLSDDGSQFNMLKNHPRQC
jgi:signal transduction histidine kinase